MLKRLFLLLVGLSIGFGIAACASPAPASPSSPTATLVPQSPTLAPTTAPSVAPTVAPTIAPTATAMPTSDNCVACHTSKATLEQLATKTTVKSEATSGEG